MDGMYTDYMMKAQVGAEFCWMRNFAKGANFT